MHSTSAKVTIIIPPQPPFIMQGSYYLTVEYKEVDLECFSLGGKPAAQVILLITLLTLLIKKNS